MTSLKFSLANIEYQSEFLNSHTYEAIDQPLGFSINYFLFRYVAGDACLREARGISRKRLALAMSGIPTLDKEALLLKRQIERYESAHLYLKSADTLAIAHLCKASEILEPDANWSGEIRTTQNFIWSKAKGVSYTPPPPTQLPKLLEELFSFINNTSLDDVSKAYAAFSHFNAIHPFNDANGRISRLLWQVIAEKSDSLPIAPFIYRLNKPNSQYVAATQAFGCRDTSGLTHPFWEDSILWGERLKNCVNQTIRKTQKTIEEKLCLIHLHKYSVIVLQLLWRNPIIYIPELMRSCGFNKDDVDLLLIQLTQANILQLKQVRYPVGEYIFECTDIMNCFNELENQLFTTV